MSDIEEYEAIGDNRLVVLKNGTTVTVGQIKKSLEAQRERGSQQQNASVFNHIKTMSGFEKAASIETPASFVSANEARKNTENKATTTSIKR